MKPVGMSWVPLALLVICPLALNAPSLAATPAGDPLSSPAGAQAFAAPARHVDANGDDRRTSHPGRKGQLLAQAAPSGQPQPLGYSKEQIEELKKQNDRARNQNDLIKQATEAMTAKNWQAAVAPLQQLIADDPNNWQYYSALGDVQFNLGSYDQALAAYQKGIALAQSSREDAKNPADDPAKKKAAIGKMLTQAGNAFLKLRKTKEAVDAFTKAASIDPNPGTAYFNLCATMYNAGDVKAALDACDRAIAADPKKADAYFIKGSLLVGESRTDAGGKVIAPAGAVEALTRYLQLAPDGAHAKDVKEMLAFIGTNVETTYKKGKGK
jgi:tetratricopeptide (TPR) repeat protein